MKLLNTLLVWLLLLTIPLQGFAAVSMALCSTPNAPNAPVASAAMPNAHAAMPSMDGDEEHCATPAGKVKCSSCAFCCVGAAIVPDAPRLAGLKPAASERIAYRPMHITAHIAGGLERPPHSPLA